MIVNIIIHHIKLLRPINLGTAALAMLLAGGIVDNYNDMTTLSIIIIVVVCFTGGANSLNDVLDFEIDIINRPSRPIPSGKVKKSTAAYISLILFIIGFDSLGSTTIVDLVNSSINKYEKLSSKHFIISIFILLF